MARARARLDWDIGLAIVEKVHNVNCTSNHQRFRAERVHPIRSAERRARRRGSEESAGSLIDALAAMYCE